MKSKILLVALLLMFASCLTPRESMFIEGGRRETPGQRHRRLHPGLNQLYGKDPCKVHPKKIVIKKYY